MGTAGTATDPTDLRQTPSLLSPWESSSCSSYCQDSTPPLLSVQTVTITAPAWQRLAASRTECLQCVGRAAGTVKETPHIHPILATTSSPGVKSTQRTSATSPRLPRDVRRAADCVKVTLPNLPLHAMTVGLSVRSMLIQSSASTVMFRSTVARVVGSVKA